MMWKAQEIEEALQQRFEPSLPAHINGIGIDSREIGKNDLFVAIHGTRLNGHDYIGPALKNGACALIIDEDIPSFYSDIPLIKVENTSKALWQLAAYRRKQFRGHVIAITGSVGKTTTKNLLALCLEGQAKVHKAKKSHNNQIGVSLTLANLDCACEICICEIGMNHRGEIFPLTQLVAPDIAVITTIGQAHIGHMGSLEAIAREKSDILNRLPPRGLAIVPDFYQSQAFFKKKIVGHPFPIWFTGERQRDEIRWDGLKKNNGQNWCYGRIDGEDIAYPFPYDAPHLAFDSLLCLAVCHWLDVSTGKAIRNLAAFNLPAGRGKLHYLPHLDITIIDDSYNASVESMRASLAFFMNFHPQARHVAILGDMAEMGDFSQTSHQALAGSLSRPLGMIFSVGTYMKYFSQALSPTQPQCYKRNLTDLMGHILSSLKAGDVVLLKGSRAMGLEHILKNLQQKDGECGYVSSPR